MKFNLVSSYSNGFLRIFEEDSAALLEKKEFVTGKKYVCKYRATNTFMTPQTLLFTGSEEFTLNREYTNKIILPVSKNDKYTTTEFTIEFSPFMEKQLEFKLVKEKGGEVLLKRKLRIIAGFTTIVGGVEKVYGEMKVGEKQPIAFSFKNKGNQQATVTNITLKAMKAIN
ncbi:MAG: hypothetical protein O7C59_06020 [Rickettsia endosymbiont of Ixodes persulcatus]|nr:hypothetical protein [Rickettsia endosymbiont of Ixodes persulcatus]